MVQYNLNNLSLFSNVRITRDYSVVHDMVPETWYHYLTNSFSDSDPNKAIRAADTSPPVQLYSQSIDYYRLPQTIRIQANYDTIRKATYGVLVCVDSMLASMNVPSFKYLFFWVDSVHLVKQTAEVTGTSPNRTSSDVVELDITPDAWSNKFTDAELYDSFILRRHEVRWYRDHTDPDDPDAWVYHPRYFPNAADDVGGAYDKSGEVQDLSPPIEITTGGGIIQHYHPRYIIINYLSDTGVLRFIAIPLLFVSENEAESTIFNASSGSIPYMKLLDLLNGDVFTVTGISAAYVQSIIVTPVLSDLNDRYVVQSGYGIYNAGTLELRPYDNGSKAWLAPPNNSMQFLYGGLYDPYESDVDPDLPSFVYDALHTSYNDTNEPMLYRSPARLRKIISGMGGTIINVPDIDAFQTKYTEQNIFDLSSAIMIVFGGDDIEAANAKGNLGTLDAASLPIFESAWKTYEAIQKTGDDIAFNALQVSTAVNGITGIATGVTGGVVGGAIAGGGVGAVAGGLIGGIGQAISTQTKYWSNSENLRAKRETIKNSPCTVVNSGSGLGATIKNYVDVHFMVLKLDDVSLNKLRTQYYYYGYNVNMVVPGTIDTDLRKYFDYIETRGAQIRGDLNAEEASQIAAIFDRGVRIYHGPAGYVNIGAGMSLENPEKAFTE